MLTECLLFGIRSSSLRSELGVDAHRLLPHLDAHGKCFDLVIVLQAVAFSGESRVLALKLLIRGDRRRNDQPVLVRDRLQGGQNPHFLLTGNPNRVD